MENKEFDSIKIGLASPDQIRAWSYGEVKKPETINYRTLKPERDGLFCERIFGPTKDWECHCGKYKRIRYKGKICDKCGVEVTRAKVRRERMGHIELAAPVSHIWYFKGIPSRIGLMLDIGPRQLDKVLYFANYIVTDPGFTPLEKKQLLTEREYKEMREKYEDTFEAGMGAEAVQKLLAEIDLEALSAELHEELEKATGQKRVRLLKRLECVDAFRLSGQRPEWMILNVVPVIPPDIRPMVQLDGGRFATSDLNDLYRRVINRNNRLKRLLELGAPDIIVRNEKRMLQEAVDALIDNGRRGRPVTGPNNRALKSLSDMLKGKQGRFRQNLLGKRVDYSGRSVIVVGPELKMYQCGLPKEMALELFKPFVMKKLVETNQCQNIKSAKRRIERADSKVWDVLEEVIKDHPVMLNRAPTLHRLSIQAFEPVLIEGRALKLHPLACTAFNADFDGDQMAVHVPLSVEAQTEARFLMLASNNIMKLSDGKPVISPTQDMVMGCYYLTIEKEGARGEGKVFSDVDEAILAYNAGDIELQSVVKIRVTKEIDGEKLSTLLTTTVGRMIFNQAIPQNLGFCKRETKEDYLKNEIEYLVGKKQLSQIVESCFKVNGATVTSEVLDRIKALGYKYSTIGAVTASIFDMHIPKEKQEILADADTEVLKVEELYNMGMVTDDERYKKVVGIWKEATDKVTEKLKGTLDKFNPIWMMANSGARGSMNQIRQLSGMRGLMTDPSGKTIELPVKACFREGLTVLEYFISSHGGRKGLADTALKTADSGYMTRRLVDVSHDVIVREEDCAHGGKPQGMWISAITGSSENEVIEKLEDRIIGKYTIDDVVHPQTGEVLAPADSMITDEQAKAIVDAGIKKVYLRTILSCRSKHGICSKCYGKNMATGKPVDLGEAVGVIAAQSIGEPGTQLTMRTFHTGGVATADDITQGLPRVEELFEARKPKGLSVLSETSGTVAIEEKNGKKDVVVTDANGVAKSYSIPFTARLKVHDGDVIESGDMLTEGSIYPQDLLRIKGLKAVQEYLVKEVQSVYRMQGVEINDKHVEIIVRQMMRKVKVEDGGDTELLPGELVDIFKFEEANTDILEKGGRPATAKRTLLGITKAALATDSWLSAASFQETSRVLTEAAIKNKVDPLYGLKENVIIGKQISAGTGLAEYRNVQIKEVVERSDREQF